MTLEDTVSDARTTPDSATTSADRFITIAAGCVIIALTITAFWLSYAHLHTVAAGNGLGESPARAWAWPATLDLFIVAGELLMLRAALNRQTDPWAIGLTVVGSVGSITLNVFGVQSSDPLAYVTAAVPPTAALLAFGALMRQVHTMLASGQRGTERVPDAWTIVPSGQTTGHVPGQAVPDTDKARTVVRASVPDSRTAPAGQTDKTADKPAAVVPAVSAPAPKVSAPVSAQTGRHAAPADSVPDNVRDISDRTVSLSAFVRELHEAGHSVADIKTAVSAEHPAAKPDAIRKALQRCGAVTAGRHARTA
jgi:hypothetical protein